MPKVVDEDEDSFYVQPDGVGPPIRVAKTKETLSYPWDKWNEEQRGEMDKVVHALDLAKHHRSAGGVVPTRQSAAASAAIAARGLTKDEATMLARYKVFREMTAKDPNWQGPLNINIGPPEPLDTPEQQRARGELLDKAPYEERKRLVNEMSAKVDREREHFYDDLVSPGRAAPGDAVGKALINGKKKRGSDARNR